MKETFTWLSCSSARSRNWGESVAFNAAITGAKSISSKTTAIDCGEREEKRKMRHEGEVWDLKLTNEKCRSVLEEEKHRRSGVGDCFRTWRWMLIFFFVEMSLAVFPSLSPPHSLSCDLWFDDDDIVEKRTKSKRCLLMDKHFSSSLSQVRRRTTTTKVDERRIHSFVSARRCFVLVFFASSFQRKKLLVDVRKWKFDESARVFFLLDYSNTRRGTGQHLSFYLASRYRTNVFFVFKIESCRVGINTSPI